MHQSPEQLAVWEVDVVAFDGSRWYPLNLPKPGAWQRRMQKRDGKGYLACGRSETPLIMTFPQFFAATTLHFMLREAFTRAMAVVALTGAVSSCSADQPPSRTVDEGRVIAAGCLPIQTAYNGWLIHGESSDSSLGSISLKQLKESADFAWAQAFQFDGNISSREKRPRSESAPFRIQDFYDAALNLSTFVHSAEGLGLEVLPGRGTIDARYRAVEAICEDVG